MFATHIQSILEYNGLKKQLFQINLVQLQNKLLQQQSDLAEFDQRFHLIHSQTHHFKKQLYQLILKEKITNHSKLLQHFYRKRKDKIEKLADDILALNEKIEQSEQEIAAMKNKLNLIKRKLEKFKILPELIDEEFMHSF